MALAPLLATPAAAQPAPEGATSPGATSPGVVAHAKELHRQGLAMLESGDWERALEYFRRSRALYPSTQNITNEAICLHRLGRFDEALEVYEILLTQYAEGLDAEDRAAIGPAMAELRTKVGSLWLSSNVDATVLVDGRERGKLPLRTAIRVLQGQRKIRVVKNGYEAFESEVAVPVGQTVKIDAKLQPLKEVGTLRVEDEGGKQVGVYVDGAKVGVTPWEGLLAPGEHLVWTRLGDQGSSLSAITVVEGQIGLVRTAVADLGPEIRVTVQPRTAAIEVDGISVGTGHWAGQLPAGDHAITLFEAGYVTETKRFTGHAGGAAIALDVRLDIDEDHPRWPSMFEGNFWLGVSGGWAVTGSLGAGAEHDCPGHCSSDPIAQGILAEARAGYRFRGGLSLELAAGYLWLTKHVERTLQDSYGIGGAYTATYDITDDLYVRGPFVGPGVSYRMPVSDGISLLGRTTLGVFFSVAHDDVQGTAYTTGDAVPIVLGQRTFERQVSLFVMPELGAHAMFGQVDLGLSLGLAFFPFIEGPELPNQPLGVVPTSGVPISDIRAAKNTDAIANERAYGSFAVWVPRVSAAYTF
ncbi:MAG: PEGA domain-containing protein [Deltaproteobacteria bacterium]|jgi:hypothetical protein|nr:PEGA domain-containing protein [Deltaproteobacteria bacterium]MBW2537122.1 PEGA domain-containing protein [Deltaproteobacteria bacterium]